MRFLFWRLEPLDSDDWIESIALCDIPPLWRPAVVVAALFAGGGVVPEELDPEEVGERPPRLMVAFPYEVKYVLCRYWISYQNRQILSHDSFFISRHFFWVLRGLGILGGKR